VEPPAPHPTRKLAIENDRLRLRIEALATVVAALLALRLGRSGGS
jgi:hypothetical protein